MACGDDKKTGQSPSDEHQPTAPHPGPAPAKRYKKACRWTHRAGTGERTAASTASPTTQRKATTQKQQKLMLLVAGHTETTAPDLWGLRGGHVCLWLSSSPPSNGSSAKRVPSRSQGPYAKSAPPKQKIKKQGFKGASPTACSCWEHTQAVDCHRSASACRAVSAAKTPTSVD